MRTSLFFLGLFVVLGCGPSGGLDPDAGPDPDDPDAMETPDCTDGQTRCSGTTVFQTCTDGQWVDTQTCTSPQICSSGIGCVDCVPEQDFCVGDSVHSCTADGTDGGEKEACTGGLHCQDGACADLCQEAADNASYIGCEYWSVDLPNARQVESLRNGGQSCATGTPVTDDVCVDGNTQEGLCEADGSCPGGSATCQADTDICAFDAQGSPFAVVVSNPHTFDVQVTIETQDGTSHVETVAAGAVTKIYPQMNGFPDMSVRHTSQRPNAYKISSDAPIVAYQFNPLDNEDVFSNDGSLLIPRTTFDTTYYGMTWKTINRRHPTGLGTPSNDWHGYLTIVAWEDDTQIDVTPSANIKAGPTMAAIASGTTTSFTLNAFDVLTLTGGNEPSALEQDLTGTKIESTNGTTFGVFGGNEAIVILADGADCCADHIEEMLFPTSTWGMDFALARSKKRRNENDYLRVIAQTDGTSVSFDPSPAMGSCGTLNAGQWCEVQIAGDTEVSGNGNPIMVGHYIPSSIVQGIPPIIPSEGNGDPSMAMAVPTEQFRDSYTFLVPDEYDENFVSIVAGGSVPVTLDGNDVTGQLATFASGGFKAGRVMVNAGQHKVSCPGGCSIEVYGYSDAVSYMFAGGLDLEQIVVD